MVPNKIPLNSWTFPHPPGKEEVQPSPCHSSMGFSGSDPRGKNGERWKGGFKGTVPPPPSPEIPHPAKERVSGPYVEVVTVHSLVVQGDGHPDANVRLPLDGGRGDDEVVRVVPHQVHLEHAVQALDQNGEETSERGRRG